MSNSDWTGIIAYNEENGRYFASIFKRKELGAKARKIHRAGAPYPLRYIGSFINAAKTFDDAILTAYGSLMKEVGDPANAIVSSGVVPVRNVSEMNALFNDGGLCSTWNGTGPIQAEHLTLKDPNWRGERLGMLPVSDVENLDQCFNRYIVITYHRLSKSYVPAEFWSGTKGYERTRDVDSYFFVKANDASCATFQDAVEFAMVEYKSQRNSLNILDTHVLSVNKRGDLERVYVDVARGHYNTPFTFDRIRNVNIGSTKASNALVEVEHPMRPVECATGQKINPFALRRMQKSVPVKEL